MQATMFPLPKGPLPGGLGVVNGWRITSTFGGRLNPLTGRPGNHGGMDLAYAGCAGQPILAPCTGLVSQMWDASGGGNWTGLFGDDGCYWGMGHASRFAAGVQGRRVPAGMVVAYVGTTGGSTGPHLHIAYRAPKAAAYSDPYDLLVGAAPTTITARMAPDGAVLAATKGDDLDMATEAQVREWIGQEVDEGVKGLASALVDYRPYYVVVDGRSVSAWLVSGLQKRWLPNNDYTHMLTEFAKAGQVIHDVGMQGPGSPWIAILDLCEQVGPGPA